MVSAIRDLRSLQRPKIEPKMPQPEEAGKATVLPAKKPVAGKIFRRGILLFLVMGMSLLAWQAWQFLRNPQLMPIQTLHVEGLSQRIPLYRVNRAVAPFLAEGFLWVNLQQLQKALLQVPWVANVEVRRVWPDQLEIELTGVQPAARWLGGPNQVLGTNGKVYSVPGQEIPKDLPAFFGPATDGLHMLQEWNQFNGILAPLQLQIRALQEDPRGSWSCILTDGVRLVLGRQDRKEALARWVAVAPKIRSYLLPGASMDLRYNNGFAVALPSATTQSVSEGQTSPRREKK